MMEHGRVVGGGCSALIGDDEINGHSNQLGHPRMRRRIRIAAPVEYEILAFNPAVLPEAAETPATRERKEPSLQASTPTRACFAAAPE